MLLIKKMKFSKYERKKSCNWRSAEILSITFLSYFLIKYALTHILIIVAQRASMNRFVRFLFIDHTIIDYFFGIDDKNSRVINLGFCKIIVL